MSGESLFARLTPRERVLVPAVASVSLVIGLWLGLWSVPQKALSVPVETTKYGGIELAYRPMPTVFPFVTILILGAGAWLAWRGWRGAQKWRVSDDKNREKRSPD